MVFRLPIKKDHLAVVPSSVAFLGKIFSIKIASCDILHVIKTHIQLLSITPLNHLEKKHARDNLNQRNHGNQVLLNAPKSQLGLNLDLIEVVMRQLEFQMIGSQPEMAALPTPDAPTNIK